MKPFCFDDCRSDAGVILVAFDKACRTVWRSDPAGFTDERSLAMRRCDGWDAAATKRRRRLTLFKSIPESNNDKSVASISTWLVPTLATGRWNPTDRGDMSERLLSPPGPHARSS